MISLAIVIFGIVFGVIVSHYSDKHTERLKARLTD